MKAGNVNKKTWSDGQLLHWGGSAANNTRFSQTEVTQNACTSTVWKYNRAGEKQVSINKGLRVIAGGSSRHLNTDYILQTNSSSVVQL